MIKKFFYIIIGVVGALLSGCSNELQPEVEDGLVPIRLSVSGTRVSAEAGMTRGNADATDFPHKGDIAVMAAKIKQSETYVDWSSTGNLYLDMLATVGTKSNGKYPVALKSVQYWPFNADEYLRFAAYSPSAAKKDGANPVLLNVTGNKLAPFPDLLYSTPTTAYNKETGKEGVELTTFQHAMARLVIKVIPINEKGDSIDNYKNDNLKITQLDIQTKVTTGDFDFLASTSAWNLTKPGDNAEYTTLYTLINIGGKTLPYDSSNSNQGGSDTGYYLLPATDDVNTVAFSGIVFTLKDNGYSYTYDYELDKFTAADGKSVKLEMGKTTLLTIKIKVTDIETGGKDNVILYGTLKDWEYKGNSTVTIN